jgi:dTDP-4-dehydrorhamnose reductase
MKILLLGMNGQLGWELQRSLAPLGDLVCFGRPVNGGGLDMTSARAVRSAMADAKPDIIFNAAAYTAVDKAEDEPGLVYALNSAAPALLAEEARTCGALLVHYSTDYVFNGEGNAPWTEEHSPAPQNMYGRSKLEGERAIQSSGCRHLIFRTSWVYARRGKNFLKTMLALAEKREELRIVSDQVGAPTGAEFLADASTLAAWLALRQPELSGIYHLAAAGETSWHGYAEFIIECARECGQQLSVRSCVPVPSVDYPQKAVRPMNSRLSTEKFARDFGLVTPHWKSGVARVVSELVETV